MRLGCLFILIFMLSGCDILDDFYQVKEAGKKFDNLEIRFDDMAKKIDFLEKENQELKNIQNKYQQRTIKLENIIPRTAILDPAVKRFSIASFSGGIMAISCHDIIEYASGSKLFLSITNFMGVTFTNVSIDLEYMPNIFNDNDELKENASNLIKNTSEKIDEIKPGSEKIVEMRLPEYKPEQVKNLWVQIRYEGIKYVGDNRKK